MSGNDVNSKQPLRFSDARLVLVYTHSGKLAPAYPWKLMTVASAEIPAPVSRSYSLQPFATHASTAPEVKTKSQKTSILNFGRRCDMSGNDVKFLHKLRSNVARLSS